MLPASTRALTVRYVLALLIVGVLSLLAFLALNHLIARGQQLSTFIRLCDSQQMCCQRIAYFAMRLSQAGSASEHDIWRTRLNEETGQLLEDEESLMTKGGPFDQVGMFAP